MSEFTQGKWEARPNRVMVKGYPLALVNGGKRADVRLIAAAPEMYELLKEELIPTSDYGGILSFSREAKLSELFTRIDSKECNNASQQR